MSEEDFDYHERQRGEATGRIIVMLWLFCAGGIAGWILRRIVE